MESILGDKIRAARAAWPALAVTDHDFVRHIADRVPPEAAMLPYLSSLCAADLFLACACALGDAAGLAALETQYLEVLPAVLVSIGLPGDVTIEARQRLRIRLLVSTDDRRAKIATYRGRGELSAWIRTSAIREALQLLRQEKQEASNRDLLADWPVATEDPQLEQIRRRYQAEFKECFVAALAALTARARNILRQHFVYGMTIDQLGKIYGIHRTTALRWSHRARGKLLGKTKRLLGERFHIGKTEVESLVRLLQADLAVSLDRLLASEGA
jgi:RNA polymerase sigma-70 factor (ECF subfamily)